MPDPPSPKAPEGRLRGTVLVVEDDDTLRHVVQWTLARQGFTVIEAPGGPEALAMAAAHDGPIDLLLTDIVMGEMNGRELAERFVAQHPTCRVLYMSGYTDDEILRRGVAKGDAFLQKPFTPVDLGEAIEAVLAR